MTTVFIDANIPIFAAGRAHPLRDACTEIMSLCEEQPGTAVTDVEVLQEMMHVYLRRSDGGADRARTVIGRTIAALGGNVAAVVQDDILAALGLDAPSALQARDRIHAAVMLRLGIDQIVSADAGFDVVPGIHRLDPAALQGWRRAVFA